MGNTLELLKKKTKQEKKFGHLKTNCTSPHPSRQRTGHFPSTTRLACQIKAQTAVARGIGPQEYRIGGVSGAEESCGVTQRPLLARSETHSKFACVLKKVPANQ